MFDIVSKAIRRIGINITVEQKPYITTITLSPILWQQYVDEILEFTKSSRLVIPTDVKTGCWTSDKKDVILNLQCGNYTSPELELSLIRITKETFTKAKRLDDKLRESTRVSQPVQNAGTGQAAVN